MRLSFRRLYSSLPEHAASARTASTPRAVRLRRVKHNPDLVKAETDARPSGLTPSDFARYERARVKGLNVFEDGNLLSEEEWFDKLADRRSRIRGMRVVTTKDGDLQTQVVGKKIYLPNIIFKMVPNFTPLGKPYNPHEATFRVPLSITKNDVRSYLTSVYGVKTTYIRTDIYLSPWTSTPTGWNKKRRQYKRAVVGLEDPFYFPQMMEDMNKAEREKRQKWFDEEYSVSELMGARTLFLLRITRKSSKNWNWKDRDGYGAQRWKILQRVADQRAKREHLILDTKERISQLRQKGEAVV